MKRYGILLVLLVSFLTGCHSAPPTTDDHAHEDEHGHDEGVHLNEEQAATAGIELFTVRLQSMQAAMTFPGTVTSTTKGRTVVTPPVAGRLIRLNIQPGDKVTQGQVIGVIESTELAGAWTAVTSAQQLQDAAQARVTEAQAEINLATATLQSAETTLTRQKQLAEAGAFNEAPLQAARSELNDAESDLLTIQKELITHTEQLERMESLFADGLVSKVDVENARLDVQQDEVQVARAEARLEIAKAAYAREKRIADQGLLNSREIQTAEAAVRSARLQREQAFIAKKSAESALGNAKKAVANARSTYRTYTGGASATGGRVNLTAPISGTITHLDATQGQAIDRTQPVCEIANLDSVWVTAKVPERDAGKIKTGTPVTLTVASQPSVEFTGVVQVVGGKTRPRNPNTPGPMPCHRGERSAHPGDVRGGLHPRRPNHREPRRPQLRTHQRSRSHHRLRQGGRRIHRARS